MSALSRARSSLRALVSRRRMEREMAADLAFHLAERIDDLVAHGLARADAERRAHQELGDLVRWREQAREARGLQLLDELMSDIIYGLRWLRRSPSFTAAAVLSLAIGIGGSASMFNLVNLVLLEWLPVREPQALVLYSTAGAGENPGYYLSAYMFRAFREPSRTLVDTSASAGHQMNVTIADQVDPTVGGQMVSGNYYALLGVPAAVGRVIQPADDGAPGTGAVAVLSYGYWQRRFGSDAAVLGTLVRLNGVPFTIVGVSAPGFFGTHVGELADITVPMSMQPTLMSEPDGGRVSGRGVNDFWLELMGRLKPGVSIAQAQAEMDARFQPILSELLRRDGPKSKLARNLRLSLEPGSRGLSDLRRRFSQPLLILMAAVALMLLIACANVANLLLARAATRQREMALRASLGAGRWRLVRQLLTESLLLSVLGGSLGLLLTFWSSQTLSTLLVSGNTQALLAWPNLRVLLFTLVVSLVSGMLFGLAPAVGASRVDANTSLKDGARQLVSGGRARVRSALVVLQVVISVVLLVCAGLFFRTLMNLQHVDLGLDREHVLTMRLEPRGSNQKRLNEPRLRQLYGALLARVESVPGVRAVSLAGATPLSDSPLGMAVSVAGYAQRAGEDLRVRLMQVYPGYFPSLGIPLLAGRDLRETDDRQDAAMVAVVNEAMARRFFATPADAVGRTFTMGAWTVEIVGVARDTRDRALREAVLPLAYMTYAKTPTGRGQMTLIVRAAGNPRALAATIRQLARDTDPTMPLLDVQTLDDRVKAASRQEGLMALLSTLFGAIALGLAAVGLYGVVAYSVARRLPEFGLRLALGATPGGLRLLVLLETCAVVGIGLIGGIVLAGAAARSMAGLLFEITPLDPLAYATAAVTLLSVAILAAWLPARTASRVDPLVALRAD